MKKIDFSFLFGTWNKHKRKINLLHGSRRFFTWFIARICQLFYIFTYLTLSLLFLCEVIKPIGYEIEWGEKYKITSVPILSCNSTFNEVFANGICCNNGELNLYPGLSHTPALPWRTPRYPPHKLWKGS